MGEGSFWRVGGDGGGRGEGGRGQNFACTGRVGGSGREEQKWFCLVMPS